MKVTIITFTLIAQINLVICALDYNVDGSLELINQAGYEGAAYPVETEDGYLLKVHRIVPRNGSSYKPPVFLQHGLFATSGDFLITGPKIALAFFLADNGYDVWMGKYLISTA